MNLEKLAKLATEATPGPWTETCGTFKHYVAIGEKQGFGLQELAMSDGSDLPAHEDAAYIAAASPEVVLGLVRVAQAAAKSVEWADVGGLLPGDVADVRAALKDLDR
jgi:hypothetical protein